MLPDPTERKVNPLLFQTGIRTVQKLVQTLDIHDKNVTMANAARAIFTVRTGLALPSEVRLCAESTPQTAAHQCHPTRDFHPRYRFRFAAAGTSPSAHHGFIRDAIALHTQASSGQHRSPVRGPIVGPRPYANEQVHEESQGPDHAVWYDPFLYRVSYCSEGRKKILPSKALRNNQAPTLLFLSKCDQPNMFRITLPGPR